MIDAAIDWAARSGPPNGVFVLALLTHASTWSRSAVRFARERIGLDDDRGDGGDS